jgi:hypothetical protein
MNPSSQLRVRLQPKTAARLKKLPPRLRTKVVSLLIASVIDKVDLTELMKARKELVSLGVLLNQSLRTSWGKKCDEQAADKLLKKLEVLLS